MSNGSAHATSDDIPPTYHAELPRLKKNEVCLAYHEDEEAGFRYRKCVLPQNRHVQVCETIQWNAEMRENLAWEWWLLKPRTEERNVFQFLHDKADFFCLLHPRLKAKLDVMHSRSLAGLRGTLEPIDGVTMDITNRQINICSKTHRIDLRYSLKNLQHSGPRCERNKTIFP